MILLVLSILFFLIQLLYYIYNYIFIILMSLLIMILIVVQFNIYYDYALLSQHSRKYPNFSKSIFLSCFCHSLNRTIKTNSRSFKIINRFHTLSKSTLVLGFHILEYSIEQQLLLSSGWLLGQSTRIDSQQHAKEERAISTKSDQQLLDWIHKFCDLYTSPGLLASCFVKTHGFK